jgi:hypothetical protein
LLLAGWVHYLAFDLFVGAHIAKSSAELGLPRWPLILLLPLTFMFGPLGLLGFEVTKLLLRPVAGATAASQLLHTIRRGSPLLWPSIVAMALFALVCVGLMQFDGRLIHGVSVWQKPAKFFLSLAVQFATIGWALSYLPEQERQSRGLRSIIGVMLAAGWTEQAYIIFRAARAEASHFNIGDTTSVLLYGLMGLGALILTATMLEVGRRLWRQRHRGLMAEAGAWDSCWAPCWRPLAAAICRRSRGIGWVGWRTTRPGSGSSPGLPAAAICGWHTSSDCTLRNCCRWQH